MVILQSNSAQILALTPRPKDKESLLGFVLRTAEENGYESISDIYRLAGMTANEARSVRLNIKKLSSIYGMREKEMKCVEYAPDETNRYGKRISVYGHAISSMYVQIKNPKICPECVTHNGYIDVFTDLRYAVACPVHRRALVSSCPKCERRLSWFRPGLVLCGCGCDLSKVEGKRIEDNLLHFFMELLRNKLYRVESDNDKLRKVGFPLDSLSKLSLQTFLGLIERFYRFANVGGLMKQDGDTAHNLGILASVFANWPRGLFSFLEKIGPTTEGDKIAHSGLRGQFRKFYGSMFESTLPEGDVKFIRDAFIEFGSCHWGKSFLDDKLKGVKPGSNKNVVGITAISKKTGMTPSTIRNLINKGKVKPVIKSVGKRDKYLFHVTQAIPKRIAEGKSLSARKAGEILGIPVSVLQSLRDLGVFKMQYLGYNITSFHEYDVKRFLHKLKCMGGTRIVAMKDSHISMTEIMRMKLGCSMNKAKLVKCVLEGRIEVLGRCGNAALDFYSDKNIVNARINELKSEILGGLQAVKVSELLACDPTVIPWLITNKYLIEIPGLSHIRVEENSIKEFNEKYIFCAKVAKRLETTTRGIINRCTKQRVPYLLALRKGGGPAQPFMCIEDLIKIGIENQRFEV